MKRYWIGLALVVFCTVFCAAQPAFAKKQDSNQGKILFVPHDNRPISDEQTADVIRKMGWEIEVPP